MGFYFLKPLEGGPARNLSKEKLPAGNSSTVLYLGRIPHGFYEKEMEGSDLVVNPLVSAVSYLYSVV